MSDFYIPKDCDSLKHYEYDASNQNLSRVLNLENVFKMKMNQFKFLLTTKLTFGLILIHKYNYKTNGIFMSSNYYIFLVKNLILYHPIHLNVLFMLHCSTPKFI